jgi:hypothetical protein
MDIFQKIMNQISKSMNQIRNSWFFLKKSEQIFSAMNKFEKLWTIFLKKKVFKYLDISNLNIKV